MSALTDQITEVLRDELLHGCTSIRDPRWPSRTAARIVKTLSNFEWLADELEKRQREHAISMESSDFSRGAEHAYRAAQLTLRQLLAGWQPS